MIAPAPQHRVLLSTPQTFEPRTPRHARRQARQNPPIPLSLVFAHIPRAQLPALARVSRRFCTAAQLVLYRTLEHAPTAPAKADACVASLAGAPHLAELVTSLTIPTYPFAHGPSFTLALRLSLRSMRALATLTLPSFDADILSAAPLSLTRLTLLADTLPFAFFDRFLAARPQIVHLALPNFVGVPPGAGEVPSTAVPHLTTLDASPGLAAALAPGRPVERVTLRVASTLYDGLRPAALFDALGSELKELALVLAPDVDARTRGRLLGALAKTGEGLEVLELRLEGKSDEVSSRLFRGPLPPSFVPDRGADLRDVFLRASRLRCKRCTSRWARCCPTYGHFTPFVCALCGCQPLLNRRKDRRDWRCGRGLVRDRHYEAWSSLLALVGNSSARSGCASINPARIPLIRPLYLPFLLYP